MNANDEISVLIETLLETEQRLEQLTAGEVDSVASLDGRRVMLRRAQDQLRHAEAAKQAALYNELRVVFDLVPAMIWFKNRDNRILRVNQRGAELAGKSVAEVEGTATADTYPYQTAKSSADDLEVIRSGIPQLSVVETLTNKNGKQLWVQTDRVPVRDEHGAVIGIVVMAQDITERRRSESRFRRLLDSNAHGVLFFDTTGVVTDANEAFLQLVRYTREDLEAGRIHSVLLTPPEYAAIDQNALKELAATGTCRAYEKEFVRKDGSRVAILLGAAMFEDDPNEGVCFVVDLTERNQLEQQFRQVQKLESIGTLASGVAHDFNNILGVIQGYSELLKLDSTLAPRHATMTDEIAEASRRGATLTRQLLLLSRKQTLQLRDLDLNRSITDMANMLRRTIGEDVELRLQLRTQPLLIRADAGMMDQVMLNLAVNARDAMPKGGRLVIETSVVDENSVRGGSDQARPGSFVCLSVCDTGCGIPAEHMSRIFEPFFTTKDVGQGTGLGLATVFGIVQQHGGWCRVSSVVGNGTDVRVYLPLMSLSVQPEPAPPASLPMPGGSETILFVEDDPFLRRFLRTGMLRLGYRVLAAADSVEALELWNKYRDDIHLLLTDLVLPRGINGAELGERLSRENPALKVIHASGYSAEVLGDGPPMEEGVNFLAKPFRMVQLAQILRAALDARPQ